MSMNSRDLLLSNYLLEKKILPQVTLDAAKAECSVTDDNIAAVLVRNGFVRQSTLIDAMLEISPDSLIEEETLIPQIDSETLIKNKIMIAAQTKDRVFMSSLCSPELARYLMKPYFPGKSIEFIPANIEKMDLYLEKVADMAADEGSIVDRILRAALINEASDIHINPRSNSYTVFFRTLGVRQLHHEGDMDEYLNLIARMKDRSKMDLAERRVPQDGGFSIEHNGKMVDLRVATSPTSEGAETIVIRILDPDRVNPSLEGIGLSETDEWRSSVSRSDGLCLICGPTGSGKTTTLNATIKEMDRFGKSIYTVEDPVEYRIPYVGQVNINHAVGLDFSTAIRAFMRADPDIIILGEIRDEETARNAIKAAETGHLVLGTLHTSSIHGAVSRLRDLGIPKQELKYVLRGVLAQRLIRTTCVHCKGSGCSICNDKGYGGRTLVSECKYFPGMDDVNLLLNDDSIRWNTMLDDAYLKFSRGDTDYEEFTRVFGAEADRMIFKELQENTITEQQAKEWMGDSFEVSYKKYNDLLEENSQ